MEQIIRKIRSYYPMTDEALALLLPLLRRQEIPAKIQIITRGRVAPRVYFIERGIARIYITLGGEQVTTWFCQEGDVAYGSLSLFRDRPCFEYVETLEPTVACTTTTHALRQLYRRNIEWANWKNAMQEDHFLWLCDTHFARFNLSGRDRYEKMLKRLSRHLPSRQPGLYCFFPGHDFALAQPHSGGAVALIFHTGQIFGSRVLPWGKASRPGAGVTLLPSELQTFKMMETKISNATSGPRGVRVVWLDAVRLLAMLTLTCCHCANPFNRVPAGASRAEAVHFWGNLYGAMLRHSVPLFVMLTGALLLTVRQASGAFYRKRIGRVLWPFALWSVAYCVFPWLLGLMGPTPRSFGCSFPMPGPTFCILRSPPRCVIWRYYPLASPP